MGTVHVVPQHDDIEHIILGDDCICGPTPEFVPRENDDQEDGWMYTHHSLDGREYGHDHDWATYRETT